MIRRIVLLAVSLGLMGCGDEMGTDAGPGPTDAGPRDSGTVGTDAGTDAGPGDVDAGPGDDAGTDAGNVGDDAGVDGGGGGMPIPDPGAFMDRWAPAGAIDVPPGHGTPETAFQVGTISRSPTYIGGTFDPVTGNVFWVFRTGAGITTFNAVVRGAAGVFDYLHLHDGAGGVLGAEITPDIYDDSMPWMIDGTWTVMPDHVYVLEAHGSMGSFF